MEKEIERILEWLKQKGVYDQFIANTEDRYEDIESYFSLFDTYGKLVSFCSAAFLINRTIEGSDFWIKIFSDFHKDIRIYYRSKIKEILKHIETLYANFESVECNDCSEEYPCDQKKEDIHYQIESEQSKIKDLEEGLKFLMQIPF